MLALPAQAQSLFPAAPESAAAEENVAATLLEILQDDAARAALIRQLEAAATPSTEPAPPQMSIARQMAEYTREIAEEATAFGIEIATVWRSVIASVDGDTRVNWNEVYSTAAALAAVIAVTIALFFLMRAIGTRIFERMARRIPDASWTAAVVQIILAGVIDALIILLAWQGGYAFAIFLGETGSMDFRQSLFLNAFLLIEISKVVLRAFLSPRFRTLRLAPMGDETAAYWYFWASRLVSLLGYGLLFVVPIINDALSHAAGRSVAMLVVLTALLVAVLIVKQNRDRVAAALRARQKRDPQDAMGKFLAFIAGFWHWLAIAYLVALFVVWLTRPGDALSFMLIATLRSVIAVILGVGAMALISRAIAGGMRLPEEMRSNLPLLEYRLNAFVPTILKVVRLLVVLVVVISIFQSWQIMDATGWIASDGGRDIVGRLVTAALIVLVAMALWLAASTFIEYRLNPVAGAVLTGRERTLLSLFRNAFTVGLIIIAAMLALSELGVNIAPLLAGAGVLGLAIGFGAQKLVQDIITGAFIQFENAMNEGDVVTAGGTTGVVEKLTIRSVALRDLSGTYHLIPFSSVDTVSNFMKGFGYHLAEIRIAYREDVSEVKALMQQAFEILQESELGVELLEPLDFQGVTQLGESAVVVRGRIKTTAGMQWAVGRAYNAIIKQVLGEAGVQIAHPHVTLYMGQGKDGDAPPLNLRRAPRAAGAAAAPIADLPLPGAPEAVQDMEAPPRDRAAEIERAQPSGSEVDED